MSPETNDSPFTPRPEFWDQLTGMSLTPRALTLYLCLLSLGQGTIASYHRLGSLVGSRVGGKTSDDETLIFAARELEDVGLIERHRMPTQSGALDGPQTPYRWLLKLVEEQVAPPSWLQAREAVKTFTKHYLPTYGPVAGACYLHLSYAAQDDGLVRLSRRQLGAITFTDPKTAMHWLQVLQKDACGVSKLTITKHGRAHIYEIGLSVPSVKVSPAHTDTYVKDIPAPVSTPSPAPSVDVNKEIASIQKHIGTTLTALVEKALTCYQKGQRVGSTPLPLALQLTHFWQPTQTLLELIEEKGGQKGMLDEAIYETISRALGRAGQRPQTYAAYTRRVLLTSLGKLARDWQTKGEEAAAHSPEALRRDIETRLNECLEPVRRGTSKKAVAAVRVIFAEQFPVELRRRVADQLFSGDRALADACLTLAIKQGTTSFTTVTPEGDTGINFLPDWRWPEHLRTPRQIDDERCFQEDINSGDGDIPWEDMLKKRSEEQSEAQKLLLNNSLGDKSDKSPLSPQSPSSMPASLS